MRTMEKEMENFNAEVYIIPRLMMRLKKSVYPGLANLYEELIEKGKVCNIWLECETDEKYTKTYISYVTVKLQKHIFDKIRNRKQTPKPSKIKRKLFKKEQLKKQLMKENRVLMYRNWKVK
jgi:hypothetical protein